ncbi:MAG TPA: bifunctional riboflavin kinase/FAD synthetase, partial [Mariniphaga anaerophila]|nr:bifunctional riboflavin kinase/FAD synthetase [Mariniphaga anaerophila]
MKKFYVRRAATIKVNIYTDIGNFKAHRPVITIGTFDGVHRGHQKVIARLKEIARSHGGESVIFTFYPHPRLVTAPGESNLRLLTTLEEKKVLFARFGIDHLIVFPFTKAFSQLTYAKFVEEVLVKQLHTNCLVVGYDHRFGKNREGGFEYLQNCADKFGFEIEKLDVLLIDEAYVSSTRIREALEEGDVATANKFLGYRFTLHGTVVEGQRVGRKLGFPTANIEASDPHKLIPGYGVYAVEVLISGKKYQGMLNIGSRPTFNKNADSRSIEVHIFDFSDDLYNKEITLVFAGKIR